MRRLIVAAVVSVVAGVVLADLKGTIPTDYVNALLFNESVYPVNTANTPSIILDSNSISGKTPEYVEGTGIGTDGVALKVSSAQPYYYNLWNNSTVAGANSFIVRGTMSTTADEILWSIGGAGNCYAMSLVSGGGNAVKVCAGWGSARMTTQFSFAVDDVTVSHTYIIVKEAAVSGQSTIRIYVDGTLKGSYSQWADGNLWGAMRVGGIYTSIVSVAEDSPMQIEDVYMYDRVLTAEELASFECPTLYWANVEGAAWTDANAWTNSAGVAMTFVQHASVVLEAHEDEGVREIEIPSDIWLESLSVSGAYRLKGEGRLVSRTLEQNGELHLALTSEKEILPGEISVDTRDRQTYIESGCVRITNHARHKVTIAAGGELLLKDMGTLSCANDYFQEFFGEGMLTLDNTTLNYEKSYGAMITGFSGMLVLRNGAATYTTVNNKQSNQLGKGKVVFAGGTVHQGNASCTISNTGYEIVAGTTNTVNGFTVPLTNATITGDPATLNHKTVYTVLTATAFTDVARLTIDSSLRAAGWRTRIVTDETSETSSIELYCRRGLVVVIK